MASALVEKFYIDYVSTENFAVTVKGFNCVLLGFEKLKSMDERRSALDPVVVVSPTNELFAGTDTSKFFLW